MTSDELALEFYKTFGFKDWPEAFEVDAETYANVCQAVFDRWVERDFPPELAKVRLGRHGGIVFKDVELLLKGRDNGGNDSDSKK